MTRQKPPLWKKSCLDELMFDHIYDHVYDIASYEYDLEWTERKEEFKIFYTDVSARADRLADELYQCRSWFSDSDGETTSWDDFVVTLLGCEGYHVLGFDAAELDYYPMFAVDETFAVEEAKKRLMRLTKEVLIERWRKVMVILTTYFELLAAFNGLSSALDYLENDGIKKWEEITRNVDYAYSRLTWSRYGDRHETSTREEKEYFEKATEKLIPDMWLY